MRALVAACIVLAGCDNGVVLEVHPDPSVPTDRVNLFVGLASCDDCPGIAPPDLKATVKQAILPGDVYFLEADAVVRTAKVENGVARFRVEASELSDHLKIAVAVDASEQSAALIQNISLDSAGVYRVDLKKAAPTLGPRPNADSASVAIWPQPGGTLSCLGFERWESGMLAGTRIFIVPESDPDCDAVAEANECAPYSFLATSVPALDEVTCMTLEQLPNDGGICKLAGPSCNEQTGTREMCSPSDYCVPVAYCGGMTACEGIDLVTCLFDSQTTTTAKLKCTIPFKPTADLNRLDPCTTSFSFSLSNMGGACVGMERMLLSQPPSLPLKLDYVAKFSSRATNDSLHALQLLMKHEAGCTYKVEITGGFGAGAAAFDDATVFAALATSNASGPVRKALVPIEITPGTDCVAQPATCVLTVDGTDSIGKCLSR